MHTPALDRRVVIAGASVVAVLAVGLDLLVYFSLRANLTAGVQSELASAVSVVRAQSATGRVDDLSSRLAKSGISATIRFADGSVAGVSPPPEVSASSVRLEHRMVRLAGGATADVTVSAGNVDRSLGRLVHRELLATPLVVALAFLLLRLIADYALRPLDAIAVAARRTADGRRGERLLPSPADTRLGRMATAYDDMLDALEFAIVESRRAQMKSEQLQEHYRQVLETAHDAFVAMDIEGRIVGWNNEAERTFGWTPEEAIGRSLAETILPPEMRPAQQQVLARYRAEGRSGLLGRRLERVGIRRSGERFPMEVKAWATGEGDQTVFNSFIRDITVERKVAAQLDATLGALEKALYESQQSETASQRFFDDAAHQLRAPITGIRACAETIMRGVADPEEQNRLLAAVVREASRAGRLMSELLQMARMNDRHALLAREPCDVVAACREAADRVFYVAPQIDVRVVERGAAPAALPVLDRDAVGEILSNLLDNAVRHAMTRIELMVRWEKGVVGVHVLDDGPGLDAEHSETVFDRFVSLDGKGGSGLGLPIARQLARAHGGDVIYEEKAFVVRLPITPLALDARLDPTQVTPVASAPEEAAPTARLEARRSGGRRSDSRRSGEARRSSANLQAIYDLSSGTHASIRGGQPPRPARPTGGTT